MKAASRGFSPLRRAQRGVAAVFAAVSLLTLLAGLGLAIDVGRFFYAKRDLQRLADLAAVDGARVLSQCLGPAGNDEVTAEVTASLARNRLPAGTTPLVELGRKSSGQNGLQAFVPAGQGSRPGVQLSLGTTNTVGLAGARVSNPVDAVQVTLSRASPSRILPFFQGEAAKMIRVRAAAGAESNISLQVGAPIDSTVSTDLTPAYYSGALRTNFSLGGSRFSDAARASVELSKITVDTAQAASQLPNANDEIPVLGLLSDLENTLNESGDTAGVQLVNAYAAAVAAGRPGNNAIPPEVLGLPARGGYDGATATTGAILNAITGALTNGEVVQLPDLCTLVPAVRDLPTVAVLPALCDTSFEVSTPQGSRPFSTGTPREVLSLDTTESDSARASSGLVRVRLGLANPITRETIRVPLVARVVGARATGALRGCAAAGQTSNVVDVLARGGTASFAVGDSGNFTRSFGTPTVDVVNVLDDIGPVPVLTATIGDVLRNAGLGALAGNPLFAGLMGQSMTVRAYVAPVSFGDDSERRFCMELAPPSGSPPRQQPTAKQCNGAPASTGGQSAAEIGRDLPAALGSVQLSVQLPDGLPAALASQLQPAVNDLTETLSTSLRDAITLVASEIEKAAMGPADISLGASTVTLTAALSTQPEVFAR